MSRRWSGVAFVSVLAAVVLFAGWSLRRNGEVSAGNEGNSGDRAGAAVEEVVTPGRYASGAAQDLSSDDDALGPKPQATSSARTRQDRTAVSGHATGAAEKTTRTAVTFTVVGAVSGNAAAVFAGESGAGGIQRAPVEDGAPASAHASLAPGQYVAAVVVDGRIGPVATFGVDTALLNVELTAPDPFDVRLRVLDLDEDTPVAEASVTLTRIDLPVLLEGEHSIVKTSSNEGYTEFPDMARGRWRVKVEREGYVASEQELELPGSWSKSLAATGLVDINDFRIASEMPLTFRLVDHSGWNDLTEFRIAHTHEGAPVSFSSAGEATLVLGDFTLPLYVKLWYPDGTEVISYLEGGLPEVGVPHEISVGGERELELEVISPEAVDAELANLESWIRLSMRTDRGDVLVAGRKYDGAGTYTVTGVASRLATVSLSSRSASELPADWAVKTIKMLPAGPTRVVMSIPERRDSLRIENGAGDPSAGFTVQIYQIPNDTDWLLGKATDLSGVVPLPRSIDRPLSLYGYSADQKRILIDVPLPEQVGGTITVSTDPAESTFVDAAADGRPLEGVEVVMRGTETRRPFITDTTGPNGRTDSYGVATTSRAEFVVSCEGYWSPQSAYPLSPGRNAVTLVKVGMLGLTHAADLGAVRSLAFGATLETWFAQGRVRLLEEPRVGASDARWFELPVGEYEVAGQAGETRVVSVVADDQVDAGI